MFNGAYGFDEPKTTEEREEFKKKLRQHKNELNNPCIKVGKECMEICHFSGQCKLNWCFGV
jgi:hypothetical protein